MHVFIYCRITLRMFRVPSHPSSGEHKTVTAAPDTGQSNNIATTFLQRGQGLLLRYYDLYQRLQLQFYVLLMMGAMDTRNVWRVISQ